MMGVANGPMKLEKDSDLTTPDKKTGRVTRDHSILDTIYHTA